MIPLLSSTTQRILKTQIDATQILPQPSFTIWDTDSGIVPSPTDYTDLVNCCGELGCIEDWIVQRVETANIVHSSNLYTSGSAHRTRRRPLSSLYLISHVSEDADSVRLRRRTKRRRKNITARPWDRYLIWYCRERRENALLRASDTCQQRKT